MVMGVDGLVALSENFRAVSVGQAVMVYDPVSNDKDKKQLRVKPRRFEGHAAAIVALQVHPSDRRTACSASADGAVVVWDARTLEVKARFELGCALRSVTLVLPHFSDVLHAAALTTDKLLLCPLTTATGAEPQCLFQVNPDKHWICPLCLKPNRMEASLCGAKDCTAPAPIADLRALTHWAVTPHYAAVAHRKRILLRALGRTTPEGAPMYWRFLCGHYVTALVIDPTSCTLAAGEGKGMLTLYRWEDKEAMAVMPGREVHHWHSSPIRNLLWSSDGALLLSSAQDGVLCTWKPRSHMERFVLPRLGIIVGLACDEQSFMYLVSAEPNQLHTIDALSKQIVETRTDLPFSQSPDTQVFFTQLAVCPGRRTVAIFGKPNAISFYHPTLGVATGTQTVQPQNYVCGIGGQDPPVSEIRLVAFSSKVGWMVTVNQTDTKLAAGLLVAILRFWSNAKNATERYECNTLVYQPHDAPVAALEYHSSLDLVLSAGQDEKVKLWGLHKSTQGRHWLCLHTLQRPGLSPRAACFSSDPAGSLVLVATGSSVALCRGDDLSTPAPGEVTELTQAVSSELLAGVTMLSDQRCVVAWSAEHVFVWDAAHRALVRAFRVAAAAVLPLPRRDALVQEAASFAILSEDRIVELRVDSEVPLYVSPAGVSPSSPRRLNIVYGPRGHARYVMLDTRGAVATFAPAADSTSVLAALNHGLGPEPEETAPLAGPLADPSGPTAPPAAPSAPAPAVLHRTVQRCNFLFGGDTHTIPAVRSMYDRFMANFLAPSASG